MSDLKLQLEILTRTLENSTVMIDSTQVAKIMVVICQIKFAGYERHGMNLCTTIFVF